MRNRAQGFTLIEILVVITIIASLAGAVLILVPRIQDQQKKTQCADRLRQLGAVYTAETIEKGPPPHVGASLFLFYRQKFYIQRGQEQVLTCPGDTQVRLPQSEAEAEVYDDMALDNPPDTACSFMGRDFLNHPISAESKSAEIVACDRQGINHRTAHHRDGLNVLYNDGSVQFRDRDYLGVSSDEDIVVGEDSSVEMLRKVVYGPPRKE